MDILDYERRRNQNVKQRAEDLQRMLESSTTSDSTLNNLILGQALSLLRHSQPSVRVSTTEPSGKRLKPSPTPVRRSDKRVSTAAAQVNTNSGGTRTECSGKPSSTLEVSLLSSLILLYIFFTLIGGHPGTRTEEWFFIILKSVVCLCPRRVEQMNVS
jgi:RNase H-fold protein (predicted Holliday junction resolvase)